MCFFFFPPLVRLVREETGSCQPVEDFLPSPEFSFGPSPHNLLGQNRFLNKDLLCPIYSLWKLKKKTYKTFNDKEYKILWKAY